jgi:3-oxoacyl-[acyl-carrier-protein] synthase III
LQIVSVALTVPSLEITNARLLDEFEAVNLRHGRSGVRKWRLLVAEMLAECGVETRYYRDRARGEKALDLTLRAARQAMDEAGLGSADLDLLIYCGVGRGFLEPATAYLIARHLGVRCECFDVLDACMGWVRALRVTHSLFATGEYSRALLVSGEFSTHEYGYPQLLEIDCPARLSYTFPAYTIGEAAAASVLVRSGNPWRFHFRSDPSKANLCTLPILGHQEYSNGENLALNGTGRFMSHGRELTSSALREMVKFVRETYPDPDEFDVWFPHAASVGLCRAAAGRLKLRGRLYSEVLPRFGNLVSASVPAAIALASEEKQLHRGDKIVLCPASAGMVLALADTIY